MHRYLISGVVLSGYTGIYVIRHVRQERIYIGSTDRLFRVRLKEHLYQLKTNQHHNARLQVDWNTDGEGVFLLAPALVLMVNKFAISREYFEYTLANAYRDRYGGQALYNMATIPGQGIPAYQHRYVSGFVTEYLDGPGTPINIGV